MATIPKVINQCVSSLGVIRVFLKNMGGTLVILKFWGVGKSFAVYIINRCLPMPIYIRTFNA
jgi:hypothetical protein